MSIVSFDTGLYVMCAAIVLCLAACEPTPLDSKVNVGDRYGQVTGETFTELWSEHFEHGLDVQFPVLSQRLLSELGKKADESDSKGEYLAWQEISSTIRSAWVDPELKISNREYKNVIALHESQCRGSVEKVVEQARDNGFSTVVSADEFWEIVELAMSNTEQANEFGSYQLRDISPRKLDSFESD